MEHIKHQLRNDIKLLRDDLEEIKIYEQRMGRNRQHKRKHGCR